MLDFKPKFSLDQNTDLSQVNPGTSIRKTVNRETNWGYVEVRNNETCVSKHADVELFTPGLTYGDAKSKN